MHIMEYESSMESAGTRMQDEDIIPLFTEAHDLVAIRNYRVNFSPLPLKETIQTHCLVPDSEKSKILILICHNETDVFGEVLCNWLNKSTAMTRLLSNPIFIVVWCNITDETDRNDLVKSLANVVKDQSDILDSIQAGESKLYVLVPYYDIIVSQCYIDGSLNEEEAVNMLLYMMDLFGDIKKLRLQENKKKDIAITCEIFQQLMMCRLSNRIYDIFFADEHQYLKDKIGFAYYGPPVNTDGTYSAKQKKMINRAYNAIIFQSDNHTMDKGVVVISFIYVCFLNYKKQVHSETKQLIHNVNKENFSSLPCFVLRKCYDDTKPDEPYCRTVIDSTLRVYQSWTEFLNKNTFPKCVMCVPTDGRYQCDDNGDVLLEYYYSPSCNMPQKALRALDTTAAVAGIGSGSLLLLAIVPTVVIAPVAIVGALAVSAGAGLYSMGRSIHRLVDKSMHDENISPAEPDARAAYIGIIAGSLGFVGAGANVLIANLAKNGANIGRGAILTVDAISKANLAAGGIALTNSVCDVAHSLVIKNEKPSPLVFVQLGASILFFTNSVYNYKNTANLLDKVQKNNAIQEYNQSMKSKKDGSRTSKILSALKKSPNEKETIAMIIKNESQFRDIGVKHLNGNIIYNDQIMNIAEFTKAISAVDFADVTPIPTISTTKSAMNITMADLNALAMKIIPASSSAKDIEVSVLNLLQLFSPAAQRKLLELIDKILTWEICKPVVSFCEKFRNELMASLKDRGINIEFITQILDCLVSRAETFLNADLGGLRGTRYMQVLIVNYFLCGRNITPQLVQDCIQHLNAYVAKKVVKFITGSDEEDKIEMINKRECLQCSKCSGYYHVKK